MTFINLKTGSARPHSVVLGVVAAALLVVTLQAQVPNPIEAHDNEGYKRISITPSPQSSLATLR